MAVVSGTVVGVTSIATPAGPQTTSDGKEIKCCIIDVTFPTGTYASAGNAQVLLVGAAIQSFMRTGKTIAMVDCAFAQCGVEDALLVGAKTVAPSTQTLTCELTTADLSTEHADGAMGTWTSGVKFFVSYTEV